MARQFEMSFGSPEPRMKTEPHPHQLEEYAYLTFDKARALFWHMRTGKSKAVIDQACCLYAASEIKALIIVAPNGVHENWAEKEIPKHCWDSTGRIVWTWNTKLKENPIYIKYFHFTCQHPHKLRIFSFPSSTLIHPIAKKLMAHAISSSKGKVLLVFDESHDFRTPGAKRTKWARAFSKRCDYKRILTGTPDLNSLLHYYSQFELLAPGILGFKRFDDFKQKHGEFEITNQGYPRLTGYKNVPELMQKIHGLASVIKREDCPWLSSVTHSSIEIHLTDKQKKAQEVLNAKVMDRITDIPEDNTFAIIGELQRSFIKHQQIVSGFIGGRNLDTNVYSIYELVTKEQNPRVRELLKEVSYTTDQVIVWCQFRYDIETLIQILQQHNISCAAYYGATSSSEKSRIRIQFDKGDIQVFVGQPQSAGLGLDLSASAKIIWYSHTYNAIIRAQANERATSIANANIDLIDFWSKPIDKTILKALESKANISEYIANTPLSELLEEIQVTF